MLSVSELYGYSESDIAKTVIVHGILLGATSLVIADSIESYDQGVAVPVLEEDLIEALVVRGVFSIGGGRFGYRYPCRIEATLVPGVKGYRFALSGVVSLFVTYEGNDVLVIPMDPLT